MNTATIVHKLWNYCNVRRDDGISYGDYVDSSPICYIRAWTSLRYICIYL